MLGRLLLLALLLLSPSVAAARSAVVLQAPQTVQLAWDASPDPVSGYKVHYGTVEGTFSSHLDVGNVTGWTSQTLPAGTYFFVVSAYNAAGESGFSGEVSAVLGQPDPCALPLGATAVSVFITKLEATTVNVGSQARLNFQLGSPASPITSLTVKIDGAVLDRALVGADLTRTGGIWFTTPSTAGTYHVTLTATNAAGCSTIASKNALGDLLTIAVK